MFAFAAVFAALPGFKRAGTDELFPVASSVRWRVEGGVFRFSAETPLPPDGLVKRVMKRESGAPAHPEIDDMYAFGFPRPFAVNSCGATTRTIEGLETSSVETNGTWSFSISVPLDSVGGVPEGGILEVARNFARADKALGKKAVALLRLAPSDEPYVSDFRLGDGGRGGTCPVGISVENPSKKLRRLSLSFRGSPEHSQPTEIAESFSLAPGESRTFRAKCHVLGDEAVDWSMALKDGGRRLAAEKGRWRPNFPGSPFARPASEADRVGFRMAYFPGHDKMRVALDFSSVGKPASAKIAIVSNGGKTVMEWEPAIDARGMSDETRDVPDLRALTVASGSPDYEIVLRAGDGLEARRPFSRFAMEWEGNKLGLSGAVPPPFEPVRRDGDRVEVVLRTVTVDSMGLWRQVNAAGRDLLARPMALKSPRAGVEKRVATECSWDVDGAMTMLLTLKPGRHWPLALEIPMKGAEARLMHECADGLRSNYGGIVPAGAGRVWDGSMCRNRREIAGTFVPYLWVGGCLRGIAVFGDNDKGWITSGDVPCHEIVREGDGTVVMRLNLVARECVVAEPRTIKIGIQATPVKPMPENWRGRPIGTLVAGTRCWGGLGGVEPADGTDAFFRKMAEVRRTRKVDAQFLADFLGRTPLAGAPGSPERADDMEDMRVHHRSGMNIMAIGSRDPRFKTVFYTNARGVEYGNESGLTYMDEWSRVEWKDRAVTRRTQEDYELDPVASYRDYAAWWYAKMCRSGACDALYWDDVYACANFDLVGTDAYRLPDGRIQPSVGIFNMRALVRRGAVVQTELGRDWTFVIKNERPDRAGARLPRQLGAHDKHRDCASLRLRRRQLRLGGRLRRHAHTGAISARDDPGMFPRAADGQPRGGDGVFRHQGPGERKA